MLQWIHAKERWFKDIDGNQSEELMFQFKEFWKGMVYYNYFTDIVTYYIRIDEWNGRCCRVDAYISETANWIDRGHRGTNGWNICTDNFLSVEWTLSEFRLEFRLVKRWGKDLAEWSYTKRMHNKEKLVEEAKEYWRRLNDERRRKHVANM